MDRKHGILIFAGLAVGAMFGLMFAGSSGNPVMGLSIGAFAGAAVGWFAAAAMMERGAKK